MQLEGLDLTIFGVYIVAIIIFGIWIANREKSATASDYFLASRSAELEVTGIATFVEFAEQ